MVFFVLLLVALAGAQRCTLTAAGGKQYDISILEASAEDGPAQSLNANWNDDEINLDPLKQRDNFTYFFNLCGPLVNAADNKEGIVVPTPSTTGILQIAYNTKKSTHVIGTVAGSSLISLSDENLQYAWGPGDIARHCGNKSRQAVMIFICADTFGEPSFSNEDDSCSYTFVWNTCGACPVGSAARNGCKRTVARSSSGAEGLSGGSIVLIVFFTLLGTYLLVGVAYQRVVAGARGWDQLPNRAFWAGCWGDAMYGCNHVFCSWRNPKPLSVRYKEMNADELELDDDDEETGQSVA